MKIIGTVATFVIVIVIMFTLMYRDEVRRRCTIAHDHIKAVNQCLDYKSQCLLSPEDMHKYGLYQFYIREYCGRPK